MAMLVLALAAAAGFVISNAPRVEPTVVLTRQQKLEKLGITGAQDLIADRHLSIAENIDSQEQLLTNVIPIHIMYRKTNGAPWTLSGTGGIIVNHPGSLVTAHHVMDNYAGQYGCRRIGTNEFNEEPIFPIIAYSESPNEDDSIMCTYKTNSLDYPTLALPKSTNSFVDFDNDTGYQVLVYDDMHPLHIRQSTSPSERIELAFTVRVKGDTTFLYFKSDPYPGESGTVGILEEERDKDTVIITVQRRVLPEKLFSKNGFTEEMKRSMGWRPDRFYGIAHMVRIH